MPEEPVAAQEPAAAQADATAPADPAGKAAAQTTGLLQRFRPGQSLDDELAAFERERGDAVAASEDAERVRARPGGSRRAVSRSRCPRSTNPSCGGRGRRRAGGDRTLRRRGAGRGRRRGAGEVAAERRRDRGRGRPRTRSPPRHRRRSPPRHPKRSPPRHRPPSRNRSPSPSRPPARRTSWSSRPGGSPPRTRPERRRRTPPIGGDAGVPLQATAAPTATPGGDPQWPARPQWPGAAPAAGLPFLGRPAAPGGRHRGPVGRIEPGARDRGTVAAGQGRGRDPAVHQLRAVTVRQRAVLSPLRHPPGTLTPKQHAPPRPPRADRRRGP